MVPEYHRFCTGNVVLKQCRIVGTNTKVPMLHEEKEAPLGEVIDLYVKLSIEEAHSNTFLGKLKDAIAPMRRRGYDRSYILHHLKRALSGILVQW